MALTLKRPKRFGAIRGRWMFWAAPKASHALFESGGLASVYGRLFLPSVILLALLRVSGIS